MCPGISQSSKRGVMNDPKSCQKSKLEVIFAKCAPMIPCPPLAQPLGEKCKQLCLYEFSVILHLAKLVAKTLTHWNFPFCRKYLMYIWHVTDCTVCVHWGSVYKYLGEEGGVNFSSILHISHFWQSYFCNNWHEQTTLVSHKHNLVISNCAPQARRNEFIIGAAR